MDFLWSKENVVLFVFSVCFSLCSDFRRPVAVEAAGSLDSRAPPAPAVFWLVGRHGRPGRVDGLWARAALNCSSSWLLSVVGFFVLTLSLA